MSDSGERPRVKTWRHSVLLTEHVFDKMWALDLTLSEFRALLEAEAEVIDETVLGEQQLEELLLYMTGVARCTWWWSAMTRTTRNGDHGVRTRAGPLAR
jgi:hypothetical protein